MTALTRRHLLRGASGLLALALADRSAAWGQPAAPPVITVYKDPT